jgi:hypothetical protein
MPVRNNILLLLLGLWSCGHAQLVQVPVCQLAGLSLRSVTSISLKNMVSYDIIGSDSYWSRAAVHGSFCSLEQSPHDCSGRAVPAPEQVFA